MDDEKPADVARHQTHFGFDRRGWEAIAIVLLMGLIALPTSHAPSKSAPNRDPPGKIERGPDRSVDVLNMDLDTLLVEASLMPKPQAAPDVREWLLHRGLPTIEVPTSLLGNQEALTKRGQRKIGVFSLPLGAENYRFWTDPHHRDECPRGDEQISRGALERPPGKPRYVAAAFRLEWKEDRAWIRKTRPTTVAMRRIFGSLVRAADTMARSACR